MPKKIIFNKVGNPEVLEYVNYNLEDNISPKEVRINQTSIGLNYIDTYHRSGTYPLSVNFPICPGIEGAGEVIGIGNEISNFNVGDRVCYASPPIGAYCEVRDFPEDKLLKLPDEITNDIAASIFLKGLTVEYLFERLYKIKEKEFILFHAAAGGVGTLASQWAKSKGCKMIGTVGSEDKAEIAKKNGCEFVINYKKENVVRKVNEITNGNGVPVVYDGVGKDTFEDSIKCLSLRGLFVSFGQSSGMIPDVNLHKTFNPKSLYYTRPTLMHYNNTRDELENSSNLLFKKINKKEINLQQPKIYELKDAKIAHTELESRKTKGSAIFKI